MILYQKGNKTIPADRKRFTPEEMEQISKRQGQIVPTPTSINSYINRGVGKFRDAIPESWRTVMPVASDVEDVAFLKDAFSGGSNADKAISVAGFALPWVGSKVLKAIPFDKLRSKFTSEIDWGKWNEEILGNADLMDEYNTIEESTKKSGEWMKTPGGSAFDGTPEQFIQQRSKNFQKAFPGIWEKTYRGTQDFDNINAITRESPLFTGDSKLASMYARERGVQSYWHPDKPAAMQSPEAAIRISKLKDDITLYSNTGQSKKLKAAQDAMDKENVQGMYELAHPASYNGYTPQYKTIDAQGRVWSDISEGATDDLAKKLKGGSDEFIKIKNTRDPILGEVKILNTTTPLKSLRYNNGMFDMTNPNIYKGVAAGLIGSRVMNNVGKDNTPQYSSGGKLRILLNKK